MSRRKRYTRNLGASDEDALRGTNDGPTETIELIVEQESQHRAKRSLERRLARSRIGRFKPMADYEWDWPKRIDRDAIETALRLEFLDGGRNIVLVAPQGLGKTMIARNIAHQAVLAGHSVLFVTAAQLLLDLAAQDSARALERRFRHYCRPSLLCLDEIGYLSYLTRESVPDRSDQHIGNTGDGTGVGVR